MTQQLHSLLAEIDRMKAELDKLRPLDNYRIAQTFDLEYTYESNRIEGNTLTLKETDLVINEGLTVGGKPLKDHLEAINHRDALVFVKQLVQERTALTESILLQIHGLILRGIDNDNAGRYRSLPVMIKGSQHIPPQPYLVPKQMEDFFIWHEAEKEIYHPVLLAAEIHERLVTVHPFIDGNGRTARLLMNLILLQHGYAVAILKGDQASRIQYYDALEKVQTTGHKNDFLHFIAEAEKDALTKYLEVLGNVKI